MNVIRLDKVLTSNEELIDSALRSALIFNSKSGVIDYDGVLAKAVLGFILDEKEAVSPDDIIRHFSLMYGEDSSNIRIPAAINLLVKKGLISKVEGKLVYSSEEEKELLIDLKSKTEKMIARIRSSAESYLNRPFCSSISFIDLNIKKALSVYLNQFSFALFGVKKPADEEQTKDAIQICTQGIQDIDEADALVLSLSETIQNPGEEDRFVLETWAKAYFAAAMTGIDPMLNQLQSEKMRGKVFLLDTDIVLHCLVDHTRLSSLYSTMVKRLIRMGCKVIVPGDVLSEVRDHAEASKKRFRANASSLVSYSDDMLDAEVNNVFIENFVHMVQSDLNLDRSYHTFAQIVDNVCDPSYPELLSEVLNEKFDSGLSYLEDIVIDQSEIGIFESLSEKILRFTELSDKAQFRTEEDNERISRTDARLYFYVYHENEHTDTKEFLSSKVYLLTNTTKSLRAAREIQFEKDNIVCSPSVLSGVLMQIGEVPESNQVLNLFENPFLAYTGSKIWEKIEPLVRAGAQFKVASIRWMHKNHAGNLDRILTAETYDEKIKVLHEFGQKGLVGLFSEEQILATYDENKQLKEELEKKEKEIERYKAKERMYSKPPKRGKTVKANKRGGCRSKKK